jgi:hypothetical protein
MSFAQSLDALARKLAEQEMARRRAARDRAGPKGSKAREDHKRREYEEAYGVDPLGGRSWKTLGACAEAYLLLGWPTLRVLKYVKLHFPDSRTSLASIRWYASKLRKEGKLQ